MNTSNYLINFLQDIDTLISEINRLERINAKLSKIIKGSLRIESRE